MLSRKTQWDSLPDKHRVVFDRSVDEDLSVFCKMHYENGFLDSNEFGRLTSIYDELQVTLPSPDLIFYLYASLDVLKGRIEETHPAVIVNSLLTQIEFYEGWIARRRESVLRIDNSRCVSISVEEMFYGIL